MSENLIEKARGVRAKVQRTVASVELAVIRHAELIEHESDGDSQTVAFEHLVYEVTELAIRG